MSIRITRILILLAVLAALVGGRYFMLGYAFVLLICLEVLAHMSRAAPCPLAFFSNALSVAYLWAILLNRSRGSRLNEVQELLINMVEHFLFAVVICLILLRGTQLMGSWTSWKQMLVVFLAFNLIGVGNEWFQNAMAGRALFALDGEAIKDLCVNLCGSLAFLGFWSLYATAPLRQTRRMKS